MPWIRRRVSLPTRTLIEDFSLRVPLLSRCSRPARSLARLRGPPFDRGDDFLCAVGHRRRGLDLEAALVQNLAPELHVRALEADDEGHFEPELFRGGDHPAGDDVALHD